MRLFWLPVDQESNRFSGSLSRKNVPCRARRSGLVRHNRCWFFYNNGNMHEAATFGQASALAERAYEPLVLIHKETIMTNKQNPRDKQAPETGKVENDTNKLGEQEPTQLNQGQRTSDSRHDREAHVGSHNQTQSRRGTGGGGGGGH